MNTCKAKPEDKLGGSAICKERPMSMRGITTWCFLHLFPLMSNSLPGFVPTVDWLRSIQRFTLMCVWVCQGGRGQVITYNTEVEVVKCLWSICLDPTMCFPSAPVMALRGAQRQREVETVVAEIITAVNCQSWLLLLWSYEVTGHTNCFIYYFNIPGKPGGDGPENAERRMQRRGSLEMMEWASSRIWRVYLMAGND